MMAVVELVLGFCRILQKQCVQRRVEFIHPVLRLSSISRPFSPISFRHLAGFAVMYLDIGKRLSS